MRARALIPAWGKAAAIGLTALAAIAAGAVWLPQLSRDTLCVPLHQNIAHVAATGTQRVSDTFDIDVGLGRRRGIDIERGDFSGAWSVQQLRTCLGEGWIERSASVEGRVRGEAWVFARPSSPTVMYRQSLDMDDNRVRARVTIEPERALGEAE